MASNWNELFIQFQQIQQTSFYKSYALLLRLNTENSNGPFLKLWRKRPIPHPSHQELSLIKYERTHVSSGQSLQVMIDVQFYINSHYN